MKLIRVLLLVFCFTLHSQDCIEKTSIVYQKVIESIGNKFPPPPNLKIIETERSVAYISLNTINIETKIISELCKMPDFEDRISYIIAHELAHHYLNHNWMFNTGFSYKSSINDFVQTEAYSKDNRKLAETQADLYAGFFGQISGYNTLKYAESTLNHVYSSYNLSHEIKGYPSLDERIEIINSRKIEANNLSLFFDLANVLLLFKEYDASIKLFLEIIINDFNSREIYNNIGLAYLLKAIESDNVLSNYNYPTHLDLFTRADIQQTRSNDSDDFVSLINSAENYFNISKSLDPDYDLADKNLNVLKFVRQKKLDLNKDIDDNFYKNIDKKNVVDFKVIEKLINGDKIKKIIKLAENGTQISFQNLSEIKASNIDNAEAIKMLNIDEAIFIFGLDNPKNVRTAKGNLNIKFSDVSNSRVYKVNKKIHLIKTKELFDLNDANYIKYKEDFYLIKK